MLTETAQTFTISVKTLKKALSFVGGAIKKNPIVPVLENIHLSIEDGKLYLRASDLRTTAIASIEGDFPGETICLFPFDNLKRLLDTLPEQPITLQLDETNYGHLIQWDNGKTKLTGENPVDFPKLPKVEGKPFELKLDNEQSLALVHGLTLTVWSVSPDEIRPAMTGVFITEKEGQLTLVATNGGQLVEVVLPIPIPEGFVSCILPAMVARQIIQAHQPDQPIELTLTSLNMDVRLGDNQLIGRLIDERFPAYQMVIPTNNPIQMEVDRAQLIGSLKRVLLTANANKTVKFSLSESQLILSSCNTDYGVESDEKITCQYSGDVFEIGLKGDSFVTLLNHVEGDTVSFHMSAPNRVVLIYGSNSRATMLFMPSAVV